MLDVDLPKENGLNPMEVLDGDADVMHPDSRSNQLEQFQSRLVDSKVLHAELDSWLDEGLAIKEDGSCAFGEPFQLEELSQFDHALEEVLFPQVLRMPSIASSNPVSTTEACLAVEDFLCSVATSLWDAFWSSDDEEFPFFVTDVQKLSSRHNLPHCLALVKRHDKREDDVLWEHISEIVLFEGSLQGPTYESFPTSFQVSQAVFCALHLLVSRKLSHGLLRQGIFFIQKMITFVCCILLDLVEKALVQDIFDLEGISFSQFRLRQVP